MVSSKQKDIENILNAILVNEGVRPAMLIQPADYVGNKTSSIVTAIKKLFPNLVSSDDYQDYQGTIISKQSYDGTDISLNRMGEILGYPCYSDFETLNREEPLFKLDLKVSYIDNSNMRLETPLFTNLCKDKKTVEAFKSLSTKALQALTNEEYMKILKNIKIDSIILVYVNIENIIPTQYIINKLTTKKGLSVDEKDAITKILYNMEYSDKLLEYDFQYNNPIHKGILLGLLVKSKYDVLSPFYPLQNYKGKQDEVDNITIELENALLDILDKTKTTTKTTTRRIRSL